MHIHCTGRFFLSIVRGTPYNRKLALGAPSILGDNVDQLYNILL